MNIDAMVTLGNERDTVLDDVSLLKMMDEAHVDRAVIHPCDRQLVVDNREGNDAMLDAARAHEGRLIAACTANPWYGKWAIGTLRDAIRDGARMVTFAPSVQGFILGDELLDPLLEAIAPTRVPVYIHTGPHLHASPWQLVNVAERFPTLPFIMGHCGATDFWTDVPAAAKAVPNIYLESSFARPFSMKNHLGAVGIGRGIIGSGAPRNMLAFEWEQMRAVFDPKGHPGIFGGTIHKLLEAVDPSC